MFKYMYMQLNKSINKLPVVYTSNVEIFMITAWLTFIHILLLVFEFI